MTVSTHYKEQLQALETHGWALLESTGEDLADTMYGIARHLGTPKSMFPGINIIHSLVPHQPQCARPNSLSARFGLSEFPPHTDTANWLIPARYTILGCLTPGSGQRLTYAAAWTSLQFSSKEFEDIGQSIFIIPRRTGSFLDGIINSSFNWVRVDFECMLPKNKSAQRAVHAIRERFTEVKKISIEWTPNLILVLDNWRMLHARGSAVAPDYDRQLLRIFVSKASPR